jgi:cyanophycinase
MGANNCQISPFTGLGVFKLRLIESKPGLCLAPNWTLCMLAFSSIHPLRPGLRGALTATTLVAVLACPTAWSAATPPIANVVIGGAEQRCSSYTGRAQVRTCTADWDTILEQDPAFKGLTQDDISFDADYVVPAFTYSLTGDHIAVLRQVPDRLFDPHRKARLVAHLTQRLHDGPPQKALTWAAFEPLLPTLSAGGIGRLSLAEAAMLRTAFVDPLADYRRKWQARSTPFTANPSTVAITHALVAAARVANQGRKPLIGVVTASAGPHPFADRDINVFMLQSAGADVVYLPLDGGFRQALDANDCANLRYYYDSYTNTRPERVVYHADLLFPDLAEQQQAFCANRGQKLNAVLNRLNGIYFSGGNQARHLESLVSKDAAGDYTVQSAQLSILQRRHAQGQLVVAGTSAGDHIQGGGTWRGKPVPMVGGGSSYDALKSGLTKGQGASGDTAELGQTEQNTNFPPVIYPLGGLGVFRFGVLDSHFSRRAREGRLVRASVDSAMDYGFGVDENTALLVSQADAMGSTHFSVVGAGGVFIADVRQAEATSTRDQPLRIAGVRAHYLLPGDSASIDAAGALQVTLADSVPLLQRAAEPKLVSQDRLLDAGASNFLNLATAMGRSGAHQGFGTTQNSANTRNPHNAPYYSALLTRDAHTVFRGGPAGDDPAKTPVAYSGLVVQFAPCDGECQAPALASPPLQ